MELGKNVYQSLYKPIDNKVNTTVKNLDHLQESHEDLYRELNDGLRGSSIRGGEKGIMS